eukprot:5226579-Pyramimonas_sp.AAC.1
MDGCSCAGDFVELADDASENLGEVPAEVEDACEHWINTAPLDKITRGAKKGRAIRQGGDLAVKRTNLSGHEATTVSNLALH